MTETCLKDRKGPEHPDPSAVTVADIRALAFGIDDGAKEAIERQLVKDDAKAALADTDQLVVGVQIGLRLISLFTMISSLGEATGRSSTSARCSSI